MLTYEEVPGTNIVELTIDGAITTQEFDDVIARFEASIARHGKIRVLEHVRSLGGVPPSRYWEDLKFGFKHFRDISHAAIVARQKWVEIFANAVNPFFSADIRYFDEADLDQARAWLKATDDPATPSA
ncbi:MAG: STAS/SEC14 domain-containing protein [Planctomycetota bacterium]|nr:MAG: STAS/SEC14 domain-containing protein [Planctomycetota bacterium]